MYGVELDADVLEVVGDSLVAEQALKRGNLLRSDFFDVEPAALPQFDAVVGNPPFIRYQSFTGASRQTAIRRAAEQGVALSALTSSWAPFIVHSVAMIRHGGRLAMVVPMEVGHAAYARPVLSHLARSFARITLLTFRLPLFPDLSQDTLLLLAEGRGEPFEGLGWRDLESFENLPGLGEDIAGSQLLDHSALASGDDRLAMNFIHEDARDLYRELAASPLTMRLHDIARVGIGYVSGANHYFHVEPEWVQDWQLAPQYVSHAVYRGRAFSGITFSEEDWRSAAAKGNAGYLFHVRSGQDLDDKARSYVSYGESIRANQAYKCRVRQPWYEVPGVHVPDVFLTYMSGIRPGMVANAFGAVAPNTLHMVRLHRASRPSAETLVLAWQSSLTSLSVELEGHAMGGGMLKLEPSEARRVLVPTVSLGTQQLAQEVDALMRSGRNEAATELVDDAVLRRELGLSKADTELLKAAAETLRTRRYFRGRAA